MMSNQKIGGAKFFPNPLGSGGVVQNFPGNNPWKDIPKIGFKILRAPQKNFDEGGGQKSSLIVIFSSYSCFRG